MASLRKDYSALKSGMEAALRDELGKLLGDTGDALDGPIRRSTDLLVAALQRGDAALAEEARDQLALAVMERKLAARHGAQHLLDMFLSRGIDLLFRGAAIGLGGLRLSA